jgi:hypothetical protein
MSQYWNVNDYTYHVTVDEKNEKATIEMRNSKDEKEGRTLTVTMGEYSACTNGTDVEIMFKTKTKKKK